VEALKQPGRLRLTHCSDIHLEGDHFEESHYKDGFVGVLEAAATNVSDLIVLAGDLFDTNRATGETIEWAMRKLGEQPVPVVMIPGNHDCLQPGGVFERYDFDQIANVEMFTAAAGEIRVLDALGLAVWGKGMVDHCAEYLPIADIPARPDGATWYLGMGHGIYVPDERDTDRSSPVYEHQIAASPCDYIALGHHHAAMEVHAGDTAAAYCGSPTDTIGAGATYATVDLFTDARPVVDIRLLD